MKILKSTNGYDIIVDDDIFDDLNKYNWRVTATDFNIIRCGWHGRKIMLPRIIMQAPIDKLVDHINHNRLDNRKENLRLCTRTENNQNKTGTNRLGYKGVTLTRNYYYNAALRNNKRKVHIGNFATKELAALAYNRAAEKYFGDFACLNRVTINLNFSIVQ